MDLFIDYGQKVACKLEKLAAPLTDLGEQPSTWPNMILAKFTARAPYASNYALTVDLVEVDPENLAAFGQILIKTKQFRPSSDTISSVNLTPQEVNPKVARVPVIIRQAQLYPMDLLLSNGQFSLLNKANLEKAMFRPNLSYGLDEPTAGFSLGMGTNVPSQGMAGMPAGTPLNKMSSVSLFDAVLPTIKEAMTQNWAVSLANNKDLKSFVLENPAVTSVLVKAAHIKQATSNREALLSNVPTTVDQFYYNDGAYILKQASRVAYHPKEMLMGRSEALNVMGSELVKAADAGEVMTATTDEAPLPDTTIVPEEITKPGYYRVKQLDGAKDLTGFVFTDVRNIDGSSKGIIVFTNGSVGAVQNSIVGNFVAASNEVPDDVPSGDGLFYQVGSKGVVTGFGPFTLMGESKTGDDTSWIVKTEIGAEINLHPIPDVLTPAPIEEGHYAVPITWRWASLGDKLVALADSEGAQKLSYDGSVYRNVELFYGGRNYNFRGPIVEKLAHAVRQDLNLRDAQFLGATLGFNPDRFNKYAEVAREHASCVLPLCLPIKKSEEIMDRAIKTAQAKYKKVSALQINLLKEAAFVPDPTSVDAMLSLNFISPENVSVFINYKDKLSDAINKLGQLLMAARLGMEKNIPADALLKGIQSLDKVTRALNRLEAGENADE